MAYSEELDARLAAAVSRWPVDRKAMFGGAGYLFGGNMLCGVWKDQLIVRVGPAAGPAALAEPHARPFDVTGRPMAGWIMVEPAGYAGAALDRWVERAYAFVSTLPAK
jgi:TfoX/Sxy family transcriptional regulator of competence genes